MFILPLAPGDTLLLLVPGTLIPGRSSELCWVLSAHLGSAGLGPPKQLSWLLSQPSCRGLSRFLLLDVSVGLVWRTGVALLLLSRGGFRLSWRAWGHCGPSCLAHCFCWLSPVLAPWGRPEPVATVHRSIRFPLFRPSAAPASACCPHPSLPQPQVQHPPPTPRQFLPHLPGPPPTRPPPFLPALLSLQTSDRCLLAPW